MDMIRHHDERVQFDFIAHVLRSIPRVGDDSTVWGQFHANHVIPIIGNGRTAVRPYRCLDNVPQRAFPIPDAHGDEIRAGLRVIVPSQANGTAGVAVWIMRHCLLDTAATGNVTRPPRMNGLCKLMGAPPCAPTKNRSESAVGAYGDTPIRIRCIDCSNPTFRRIAVHPYETRALVRLRLVRDFGDDGAEAGNEGLAGQGLGGQAAEPVPHDPGIELFDPGGACLVAADAVVVERRQATE